MASITLESSKLQLRCKAGELESGKDKISSISLTGISASSEAANLMGVSNAIGDVSAYPILETLRIDTSSVSE